MRSICGAAIRSESTRQVRMFAELLAQSDRPLELIGVGGASSADHVQDYLKAGAHAVHLATAAMVNPGVGIAIKRAFASAVAGIDARSS